MKTISESQADVKTREWFEDIKVAMGVAQVNLIWRRLAVQPGVIEFAWQTLRPHYVSTMIPNAAWLLREDLVCLELLPLTETDLQYLGHEVKDVSIIDDVLRTYERGNAQNLIALCYLRLILNSSSCMTEATAVPVLDKRQKESEKADQIFGKIPALPGVTGLTSELQLLNECLADLWVPEHYRGMKPSVFRHLSYWPKYLSIIADRFHQLEPSAKNALSTMADDAVNQAEKHASMIGGAETNSINLNSGERQWLQAVLDMFIHGMIARGVIIVPMVRVLISNR